MKKAFTLVELLGVIIVLGLIFLIATPIVMNIIGDYKIGVRKQNVLQIKKSAESFLMSEQTLDPGYIFNINDFSYDGEQYEDIVIEFDALGKANVTVFKENICYYIISESSTVNVDKELNKEECLKVLEGPTLAQGNPSGETSTFWGGTLKKNQIEQIDFVLGNAPTDYIDYWDVSQDKNGKILAYYTDIDNNSLYELTVTSNLKIMAPENSSVLFYNFLNMHTINFNNFDTSKVTDMSSMFSRTGYNATTFNIGDISNWDTSKVTNMSSMFSSAGRNATTFDIGDISNWDTSNVIDMSLMFSSFGYNATTFNIGDISNWDTSNVINMRWMFSSAGRNAITFNIGNLSNWDTSKVTDMSSMFSQVGYNATTFNIGDISNWDTSKVTNMSSMFSSAGRNATTFNIGNLSNWDTASVTNMDSMFSMTGRNATTWSLGGVNTIDLSGWDLTNVTNVSTMFNGLPSKITTAYARTQADADKLNASSNKPSNINFVVK